MSLPSSDDDDDDNEENFDVNKRFTDMAPLSYSDSESVREAKLKHINQVRKIPRSRSPEIDDKDTDPRPLSYSDTEEERQRKRNHIKKYPTRKIIKTPKYKY